VAGKLFDMRGPGVLKSALDWTYMAL